MAGEDIILKTLLQAGLELNQKDFEAVQRKLKKLGEDVELGGLEKQAKELGKLYTKLNKDRALLEKAATQGATPGALSTKEQARLQGAFNRVKTYQDQLTKLTNSLNNLAISEGKPLFNQLSGLQSIMKELGATTRNVAPLIDNITQSFKANATAVRKAQAESVRNESARLAQARTAETLERARRTKALQTPEGRRAFLTAARGNADAITTSASAKQGRAFAASALTASERAVQLERDRSGVGSEAMRRAERKLALSAQAYNDLDTRATQLAAEEAKAKQTKRAREAQAIRQQVLDTNARVEQQKNPRGQKAYFAAARGDGASILSSKTASDGLAFATRELKARTDIDRLTREMFGAESNEAKRTARQLDATAQAYARLKDRVEELRMVEQMRRQDATKASSVIRTESDVAQSRTLRGRTERQGRKSFLLAGGVEGNTDALTDIGQARKAQAFVKGELADLAKLQRTYANAFGASSDQAKRAALEANKYADYLDKLKLRIEALGSTKLINDKADKYAEDLRASQERRRGRAIDLANGKRVFEAGNFGDNTDRQALTRARTFARNELSELRIQQNAAARAVGTGSDEYRKAQEAADAYAASIAALDHRLDQLAKVRPPKTLDNFRSTQVHAEGKSIYEAASQLPGGVQNLAGTDAKQAQQYLKARLSEQITLGKALAKQHGENSTQAQAAGESARKLAKDLETLNGITKPATQGLGVLGSTLKSFLKYAIGYAALYALANAITGLAKSVIDLQTAFLEIQAVTGSTDAQMGRLSQTVLDVAKNSKFSLKELTDAALILAQAGVSVESMNTTLKATADFAAATGSNLQVAADLISTTRSVFKELSDDVIANQLAKAINISKLTGEDLKTILSLGAQTAKSFGLTAEQFLAAVSTLRNAGLKASTAATGLRSGMLEIFSPDLKLTKALQERYRAMGEEMGAEAVKARFFAFSKGRAPLQAALTELKRLGFNDEGSQTLSRAFDIRSSNAIKAMISNLEELAANESKITFGRAAAEGADTTIKGLNASFTRLQSTIGGFVYNRSEGVLGFFTSVINAADDAIKALDRYDLAKRAQGESGLPGLGELYFGPGLQVAKFVKHHTIDKLFPSEQTKEEAAAQADAQGQQNNQNEDQFQLYEQAAKTWDIKLAELGKNVGSQAESLVTASRTADDLNAAISNTFGANLDKSNEQMLEVVKSYTKLAPSDRADRLKELQDKFPKLAELTKDMTKGEADRALFTIQELADTVSGSLKGMTDQLNTKLVNSRKTLENLKGAAPSNPQELEAQLFVQVVAQSDAVQQILAGTSKEAMDMQLGILQQASQTLTDQLRANGAVNPLDDNAKKVSQQFIQRIKAISLSDNKSTAEADMRAAVTELLARFKELDGAAVNHLQEIQGAIFDAANQLNGGLMKKLLTLSVGKIQETLDVNATKVMQETADRVTYGTGPLVKTFQNPKFKQYLQKSTDAKTGGIQQLYSDIEAGGVPLEDLRGNSERAKLAIAKVKEYNDIQVRQDQLVEETTKERTKQLAQEDRLSAAQIKLDDATVNKQFGAQRAALNELTAAKKAIAQKKYDDATAAIPIDVTKDPEKNKALIKEQVDAKHELLKLDQEHAKQLEKIDRESAKVELGRAQRQKAGEQTRLKAVLDNATNLTPLETINSTIEQYDKVNAERLALFEKQLKQQGTLTDLSEAEIEEKRKSLAPYKTQAAYLELVFRRERQARDEIDTLLERTVTSGSLLNDARLESKGLITGNRTQRRDFLVDRQGLLLEKRASAERSLTEAQAQVADLTPKAQEDSGNKNIAESLAKARAEVNEMHRVIADTNTELGHTQLALEQVTGTWASGFKRAFDPNVISRALEQSESSFEHFGDVINDHVITAIEGVGDAFAAAVVDGESLSDSLDKVFSQLTKESMRTLIKTLSNETINSLTGTLFGSPETKGMGLFPALWQRLGFSGGKKATSTPTAAGANTSTSEAPAAPTSFMGQVVDTLFGSNAPKEKADACCLPKETGDVIKKAAQGPGLNQLVDTEGKGFFDTLTGGFVNLIDSVSNGFGQVFGNLGSMLGLFSSKGPDQASGLFGLTMGLASIFAGGSAAGGAATYKGAYGFAGGGIIHGPGSGTSDSIPTYVAGAGGRVSALRVSNGEGILNAKATSLLGENFIHAVNSGRMLHARTGAIVTDQAGLSTSTPRVVSNQGAGSGDSNKIYQVSITPAQSRMRMGDWLDQHVLDERARR